MVYRVTQSLAELGKPHTAPPQNLQTTIMRSVGGLTTKTSTRTPRARAGSAPPNSKGSVVPYKPLFSDPRARLWPSDAFAVERSLLLNLRPVSCRRRRQVALRLDCRAAWRRLDCTGFERRRSTAALPATSSVVIITCPARACIRGSAADLPASGSIRDAQVTAQSRRFWICSRTPDVDRCRRQTGMRKRLDKVPCCSCRTEHREPALRSACSACIVCTHSTRCGDCESRLQPDCERSCGLTDSNISGVGGRSE